MERDPPGADVLANYRSAATFCAMQLRDAISPMPYEYTTTNDVGVYRPSARALKQLNYAIQNII